MDYNQLLKGKRVFVTTGIRGIGKAIALLFARQGAVVAVGGKNRVLAEETEQELRAIHPDCRVVLCDLSSREETERACDTLIRDWGGVDILVNTVGINRHLTAHKYDEELIHQLFETNYMSGLRCMKALVPGMLKQHYGVIVNVSSIHSIMTMPGYMMYAGTKGAVNASARAMALDYAGEGLRVNTICPGLIMSDAILDEIETYPEGEEREAFRRMLEKMQPLPPGSMEDIANAALYLASDMSAYVTGQTILVDGGASVKAHP